MAISARKTYHEYLLNNEGMAIRSFRKHEHCHRAVNKNSQPSLHLEQKESLLKTEEINTGGV